MSVRRAWDALLRRRSLDAQYAASLAALSALGRPLVAASPQQLDWHGVRARETLAMLSAQLVRAAVPVETSARPPSAEAVTDALRARALAPARAASVASSTGAKTKLTEETSTKAAAAKQPTSAAATSVSVEAASASAPRDPLALLCVALCYVDGLGRFPRDRVAARDMLARLRGPWPMLCRALLMLVEAAEKGGGDLATAPAAVRSSASCADAVRLMAEAWSSHRLAPVPALLARCCMFGVGGDASGISRTREALEWLATGAAAGDPHCAAELARYALHVRERIATGTQPPAADAALDACLRYAAVCGDAASLAALRARCSAETAAEWLLADQQLPAHSETAQSETAQSETAQPAGPVSPASLEVVKAGSPAAVPLPPARNLRSSPPPRRVV